MRQGIASLVVVGLLAACGGDDDGDRVAAESTTTSTSSSTTTTTPPPTTAAPDATSAPTTVADDTPTTTLPDVPARFVDQQAWGVPFASAGDVVLVHPSAWVERVGFHESNHDGAQAMQPRPTAVHPTILESRERGNGATTAADMVVQPGTEVRAPVTGTVLRAGRYTLYCDYTDEYLVIAPDGHPGWEVKLLHVVGLQVSKGDRVVAGETRVARHARQLAFESQVDEVRLLDPAWPHVHLEVVDPQVPDRPGEGCD
jgi:biotin carboxyl carrier protein